MAHEAVNTKDSAADCSVSEQPLSEDQQELSKIIRSMKTDPMGIVHMGSDGVFRSLTADRDVIDAVALPRRLVKALCDRMPFDQEAEDNMRGADGTNVTKEQMYHPDKSTLPPPLTQEEKDEADEFYEENKEKIEENMAKRERGELKGCPVVVRADYDLEPRS